MATIVVYGGGFQPFHEGHLSSYLQAKKAFPDATFYVAASNDVKQRPIPFKDKQFLAQQAGVVDPFVETKNPINPQEILAQYNPEQDVYIMVRSERDPVSYTRKDGSPAYYQPYVPGEPLAPFSQHGYVFVSKKHTFTVNGEEVYSGSQVRSMYGSADDAGRMKIIQQLYPKSKQQQMIKKLLDKYLASPQEPAVVPIKTTAMSKLKNKKLAEQISKIRPLIKEASPAVKLKFMKLIKTAISESKVTELSPQTLASYKKKAGADATTSDKAGDTKRADKRFSGIVKATKKEFDNDTKGIAEMDKSQTPPGRDGHVSHSTYGSRDKKDTDAGKKQYTAKAITPKEVVKKATGIFTKAFNDIDKKKKSVTEGIENPYGYEVGQTVKLDNGYQGRVIDIFDDAIEVLLTTGKTVTVAFQDAHVMDTLDEADGVSLGKVLSWPEVANKINSAMKAMGWKGQRKGDDSFMFSTKGAEDESQYYMVMIDNEGNGMFTYALGTFEGGRPDIGEQDTLPTTEASVSEVLMAIRDGYGLTETISDDPWGPQGNFAGDTPVNVGGVSMKTIQVGDTVKYLGQKSKVLAMSKDRKYSRITILSDFGGTTKDVLTSDLQQLGQGIAEGSPSLSVEQLAHISDKALDDAYHYGRSTPGANFGWMANMQSAKAAKKLIDAGETDIEKISDAIHKGWNVTAAADYKGQLQLDTPTPDDKKLKRAKLAQQSYSQLPEEEKEKDRVVARAMLAALGKSNVTESTDYLEEK